tara:strand:+ start:54 stop:845 length:792 start_codon:yes stop_codon:yes gene_type:complete
MQKKVTSIDNKDIKDLIKLTNKSRLRKESGRFVVEGKRELQMAFNNGYKVEKCFYNSNIIDINKIGLDQNCSKIEVNNNVYSKISFRNSTEGIISVVKMKENIDIDLNNNKINLILILDGLEKPGNIGAILRSCDAANVNLVILTNLKCDIYNPNVIRSSLGTFFSNKIINLSNNEALEFLKKNDFIIYGTSLKASISYDTIKYNNSTAIISGSENKGISDFWTNHSDKLIKIPMLGTADSLNVSVSTALSLFEVNRQNQFNR